MEAIRFFKNMQFVTKNEQETTVLAAEMAAEWREPLVLILSGPLGAGKTRFVQGLAQGLHCPHSVASPTFPLVHEYDGGRLPLFHFDFYRLGSAEEVWALGFEEYLLSGIVIVEWGEKFPTVFPSSTLHITIDILSESERTIRTAPFFSTL